MYEDRGKATYEQNILDHIRGLGQLSLMVAADVLKDGNVIISYKENDKSAAFGWAVRFLINMIPDLYRDEEFSQSLDEIKSLNPDSLDFLSNMKLFNIAVNCLQRNNVILPVDHFGLLPAVEDEEAAFVE